MGWGDEPEISTTDFMETLHASTRRQSKGHNGCVDASARGFESVTWTDVTSGYYNRNLRELRSEIKKSVRVNPIFQHVP